MIRNISRVVQEIFQCINISNGIPCKEIFTKINNSSPKLHVSYIEDQCNMSNIQQGRAPISIV